MNIDMNIIRGIIRHSLQESRNEGITDKLRASRATFHALKAMCVLCKDEPLSRSVEVTGTENVELVRVIALTSQPEFIEASLLLPGIVQEEIAQEVQA